MPYKGADVLVRAVPDDVPLHIYGRPYDERYFALLKELAHDKHVTFHVEASDDEVLDALRAARMAVLPSRTVTIFGGHVPKVELFGLALAEAMACGTPVICTDAGSLPEVVTDGETGLVVPPGDVGSMHDAIERLRGDDRGWEAMSTAARRRVLDNFTWDRVAERCFEVYDDPTLSPAPRSFSLPELRRLVRPPTKLERWFSREVR
jgi:glycosyltransferase involved in cell wall biosynthesis